MLENLLSGWKSKVLVLRDRKRGEAPVDATKAKDEAIRTTLRGRGYEVVEIAASDLNDREQMIRHVARIAKLVVSKERARAVRDDASWFVDDESQAYDVRDDGPPQAADGEGRYGAVTAGASPRRPESADD